MPDELAKRRVLTVLGRTSAVLGMLVVRDEAASTVANALAQELCYSASMVTMRQRVWLCDANV